MTGFDDLSDELLLKIFLFLPKSDLLSIGHVCIRFKTLSIDKELSNSVSFQREYTLPQNDIIVYLRSRWRYLVDINLNYCYWLSGIKLIPAILRCKNLESLHLLDIKIPPPLFNQMLLELKNLESLSITWNRGFQISPMVSKMEKLEKLTMHVLERFSSLEHPMSLLSITPNLKTLIWYSWISLGGGYYSLTNATFNQLRHIQISYQPGIIFYFSIQPMDEVNFVAEYEQSLDNTFMSVVHRLHGQENSPALSCLWPNDFINFQEFVINLHERQDLPPLLRHLEHYQDQCGQFVMKWISRKNITDLKCLRVEKMKLKWNKMEEISQKSPNLQSLRLFNCKKHTDTEEQIVQAFNTLVTHCTKLTHLNLGNICLSTRENLCTILSKLTELKHLCLPVCMLRRVTDHFEGDASSSNSTYGSCQIFRKKRRIGMQTHCQTSNEDARLNVLVSSCVKIEEFELINMMEVTDDRGAVCECLQHVHDEDIAVIGNWKKLQKLTMVGVSGIRHGGSLVAIAKGCIHLKSLRLDHFGSPVHMSYGAKLKEAFHEFKNLKDFRLDQNYLDINTRFLDIIESCVSLERLTVACRMGLLEQKVILQVVEKLPKLICLLMRIDESSNWRKTLQKQIVDSFKPQRPALSVLIGPSPMQEWVQEARSLPSVHVREMAFWESQVGLHPLT